MRRSFDNEKKKKQSVSAGEKRSKYVQNTLREIRQRRLSAAAPAKGLFPNRTPSRILSSAATPTREQTSLPGIPPTKRDVGSVKDRPTLSLTKLDFELLREWNWKERQKRLETWGKDLGLTKAHRHFRRPRPDEAGRKSGHGHLKAKIKAEEGTSTAILRHELEHLTGLRVYAPGTTAHGHGKGRTLLKSTGLPTQAPTRRARQSHGAHDNRMARSETHRSDRDQTTVPPHALIHQRLDRIMSEATELLEIKKNFGKGWFGKPSLTGSQRKLSLTGTQRKLSLTGTQRKLSLTGTQRKLSLTGTQRKPSLTESQRKLSLTGTQRKPSLTGTQRKPSLTGTQASVARVERSSSVTSSTTTRRRRHHHRHDYDHRTHETASHHRHHHHHHRDSTTDTDGQTFATHATSRAQTSRTTSVRNRTDIEEEQVNTSYSSRPTSSAHESAASRRSRMLQTQRSDSPSTPSDNAPAIAANDLFRGLRKSLDTEDKSDDGPVGEGEDESENLQSSTTGKYVRPEQPVEYQDTCFGGIHFVDRSAVKPMTKVNKDFEFYVHFDDTQLGLGMGTTQQLRVKFFKASASKGRSSKILERRALEKARKEQEKEEKRQAEEEKRKKAAAAAEEAKNEAYVIKNLTEIPETGLLSHIDLPPQLTGKNRRERMAEFEKALMDLPGISSRWHIEVSVTKRPSHADAVNRIPKRGAYTRPPRRIWYMPLPLTIKKYYRTNWKKIRFDIRKLMKDKQFWPKLWINFEESHPKKLYELIRAKLAVKDFDKYGFKRVYDWGRGVHPDYIDWIIEDIVPHPGRYFYKGTNDEAIRRASVEEADFRLQDWFVKPPRYIPNTPLSPPFDQYDFCGYGNREKPYFLPFTVPREILHYYSPPSNIQRFFRNIPMPPYAFPGYTFKRWLKYPLDQKLPQYYPFPTRFAIWTKGKIGETVQCNSTNFYIDDPYIKKRDIAYSPYHDRHTRKYILRKDVLDRIWELGIINSKGEVKCSMAEFNKNRLFLREYEWLEEAMRRWNRSWYDRQQKNILTKETIYDELDWELKKMEWVKRLERCKMQAKLINDEQQKKFRLMVERTQRKLDEAQRRKMKEREEQVERARKKQSASVKRRQTLFQLEAARKYLVKRKNEWKDHKAQNYRKLYYLEKVADKAEKQSETWKRHLVYQKQRVANVKFLEMELEKDFRRRTQEHKKKMKREWGSIQAAIIRKKLREHYESMLVLKYFRIWRNNVCKRREALPDPAHLSAWHYTRHMEYTVNYLKDMSGYVGMDALFLTTVKAHDQLLDHEREESANKRPKTRRQNSVSMKEVDSVSPTSTAISKIYSEEGREVDEDTYLGSDEDSDGEGGRDEDDEEGYDEIEGYDADEDEDV